MEPERWPPFVRGFVDELGTKRSGIEIQVDYEAPFWVVMATCPCCGTQVRWTLMGGDPTPEPIPIAEPAWYAKLNDLPPGDGA